MNQLKRWLVWVSRCNKCRGFGIQSPTDYAFVRYVVNEHWPYYAYQKLTDGDWLTQKLGRLYFRLANWRQPQVMANDRYRRYWQAGCTRTRFEETLSDTPQLVRIDIDDTDVWQSLLMRCDEHTVVVVEGIWRNWRQWRAMERDERTGTTFDLYYCGIVWFDKRQKPRHYVINF